LASAIATLLFESEWKRVMNENYAICVVAVVAATVVGNFVSVLVIVAVPCVPNSVEVEISLLKQKRKSYVISKLQTLTTRRL
jgi:hypothetical protein